MKYVPKTQEAAARRLVSFESCGSIDRTGSVLSMQQLYGWLPGGQVRLGNYIYNIGPTAVNLLRQNYLVKD